MPTELSDKEFLLDLSHAILGMALPSEADGHRLKKYALQLPEPEKDSPSNYFLRDLLITALESGINYWCSTLKYDFEKVFASVMEHKDRDAKDPGKVHEINGLVLTQGCLRIAEPTFKVCDDIRNRVLSSWMKKDIIDIDSEAADVIVQAGLFGEIVYG